MVLYDWANGGSVGIFIKIWYGFRSMGGSLCYSRKWVWNSVKILLGGNKEVLKVWPSYRNFVR